MKKLVVLILLFFFLSVASNQLHAQPDQKPKDATQSASPSATIQYDLAFPGMLPDHPLYKLKVLRDKISLAFISDPQKKADLYLKQTDKGILAAAMLVDKNKIDLAQETALKAEHNFTLLTQQLWNLPKKPGEAFFEKLKTAATKHQEVLTSLAKRVPDDKKETFNQVTEFSKRNVESIEEYKSSKSKKE